MKIKINKTNKQTTEKYYLIINLKAYKESLGKKALKIAKAIEKAEKKYKHCEIILSPQFVDLRVVNEKTKVKTIAQHVDSIKPGAHTGKISIESIKDAKAIGSLINHSEHQLKLQEIHDLILALDKNNLISIVCSTNEKIGKAIASLNPDMIAIEPPELIGTKISVSKAKPELIKNSVRLIKEINRNVKVLCGAGINTSFDVYKALQLGSDGILVASAIAKSREPSKKINEFCKAIETFHKSKQKNNS